MTSRPFVSERVSRTDKEALEELHNLVIILSDYSGFRNVDLYKNLTVSQTFVGNV